VRALRLFGDRDARLAEMEEPPPPGPGEIQLRMLAVALNHIDVWGWRGMAFAKRKLPMTIGAEAVGEVAAVGPGVEGWRVGQRAAPYGALTCGHCRACREGRDNLCENVSGVLGFHLDGFAQEKRNVQARQWPQVCAPYITTFCPGAKPSTPSPSAAISPEASAPTTSGSLRLAKAMPRKPHTSR